MTATTSEKNTMTARRFFTEIQSYDLPAELLDYAANEIQKLDDAKEKRKEKPTKAQKENAAIREQLHAYMVENLSDEYFSRAELGEALEISPNKAGALARQLVQAGLAEATDVKVKGGTRKGYRAIQA